MLVLDFVGNCERLKMVQELSESVSRIRGPSPTLEQVDAPFRFEFASTPRRILELLEASRTPVSREQLIADLQALGRDLGRMPGSEDVAAGSKERRCCSLTRYVSEFGTFNAALIAAGFTPLLQRRDREQLIADLQALGRKLGRTPTARAVNEEAKGGGCATQGNYTTAFGSFPKALHAAGFVPNIVQVRRSDSQLVADLQELGRKLGRTPTVEAVAEASMAGTCASPGVYFSQQSLNTPSRRRHSNVIT